MNDTEFRHSKIGGLLMRFEDAIARAWQLDTESSFRECSFSRDRAVTAAWNTAKVVRQEFSDELKGLMEKAEAWDDMEEGK